MTKYRFAILKSEAPDDHLEWLTACKESPFDIEVDVIDISKANWLNRVLENNYDCYLTRPGGAIGFFKQMYDERLYIIQNVLKKKIYPTYEEVLIYENKRMLSYWLQANKLPHARTHVFYEKSEADLFSRTCSFPLIGKTAIGAAGSGIQIIRNIDELKIYLSQAFSQKGITRKWMPNLRKGKVLSRVRTRITNIPGFWQYLKRRHNIATIDPQRWYVILQDYIDVVEEWRTVRIGDSFFAHKKKKRGDIFSGGGGIDWDGPSIELLDFIKMVTEKRQFLSQAIDVFVDKDNRFYVNELQCFFGYIHPKHQMIIDGIPGRYIIKNKKWCFEEGTFNINNSYNLRVEHVISLLNKKML